MCLILVAWRAHPQYPLVVAANRDEFFARPSAPAGRWAEDPRVVAGRDLEAGGTWLGIREDGRFAAVTNVREPGAPQGEASRGHLTRDFLLGSGPALGFAEAADGPRHSGFNLLVGDGTTLAYRSNRGGPARALPPGVFGVSNHLLDTPWPKLTAAKARFAQALASLPDPGPMFAILADREIVPDEDLPATGLPLAWERALSAVFVQREAYGTRASTVLVQGEAGGWLEERSFDARGEAGQVRVGWGR